MIDGLNSAVLAVRDTAALHLRLEHEPLPLRSITVVEWNALDSRAHLPLMGKAALALGQIDLVLCAVGSLGHSAGTDMSADGAAALFDSNFTGPATALTEAARHLVEQGDGTIVVLSSIAGLRPRKSNYLYGSAKAGLDSFAQGLADGLAGHGVRVHLIRPGFVTSKMTTGLKPAPFATTAEVVAEAIASVVTEPQSQIVHVPRALGPIFAVLKMAPRPLWRRIAGDR